MRLPYLMDHVYDDILVGWCHPEPFTRPDDVLLIAKCRMLGREQI